MGHALKDLSVEIIQNYANERVKFSRSKSYQNVGGIKVAPAIVTIWLRATGEIVRETVVPHFARLESSMVLPFSVS